MPIPTLHVLAGPNGAGKSTLYRALVAPRHPGLPLAVGDEARLARLALCESFATETAFSHPSKLELLARARDLGFGIALYIVCVDEPRVLLARMRQGAAEGGADVPAHKLIARYPRMLLLLQDAIAMADTAFLFDGSDIEHGGPVLIASTTGSRMHLHTALRPRWVEKMLGFAAR